MNKDVRITVSKGPFKKIREWNRRKKLLSQRGETRGKKVYCKASVG